jgi:hypothetical protein
MRNSDFVPAVVKGIACILSRDSNSIMYPEDLIPPLTLIAFSPPVAKSRNSGTGRRANYKKIHGIQMATFVQL